MNELEQAKELLQKALNYFEPSNCVNTVYIPYPQQLRNQADEIEKKEEYLNEVKLFLGIPTNITFNNN